MAAAFDTVTGDLMRALTAIHEITRNGIQYVQRGKCNKPTTRPASTVLGLWR